MAARTLPGLGLKGDWALGEDGWKDENDLNLLTLSVLTQGRVLSIEDATPGAPAEGAVHIFSAAHPTNANAVAIFDEGAWKYIAAVEGLSLFNVADDLRYEFKNGEWYAPIVVMTQAAYDALAVKNAETLYFVTA